MDRREFDRRVKALGTESRALPAARDVLVNGSGLRPAASKHGVDAAQVQRLVRRIEATDVCPTCGQVRV